MRAVSLGLGARKLRDTDYFSKSDPFCVVSRPNLQGGFTQIRISETKQNTLNPDWNDFFFKEEEVPGHDMTLNLKIEVFDDDGKKGLDNNDKLLGTGHFSLKQLEAASLCKHNNNNNNNNLPTSLVYSLHPWVYSLNPKFTPYIMSLLYIQ
ncbi:copine-8 [Eurytemora carolleeae]|uniref:copine-8 n=1 Tax=Eurytemora carolleeae TaxID=1294199 RepID=UPI000C77142E|nr:copine-8 [Eurytemora carolleeae]|eukprot:XP_023344268.1 copine-8-like [Eurytemora affinis]